MATSRSLEEGQIEVGIADGPVTTSALAWPVSCGAECVFLGRTRAENDPTHGPLARLEYEVYEPMARKVLLAIAQELCSQFDCRAVRIVHARGNVAPGEASVVIQVATPHRAASFTACRHAIERIKQELPVWKRQVWRDGFSFAEGSAVQEPPDHGEGSL